MADNLTNNIAVINTLSPSGLGQLPYKSSSNKPTNSEISDITRSNNTILNTTNGQTIVQKYTDLLNTVSTSIEDGLFTEEECEAIKSKLDSIDLSIQVLAAVDSGNFLGTTDITNINNQLKNTYKLFNIGALTSEQKTLIGNYITWLRGFSTSNYPQIIKNQASSLETYLTSISSDSFITSDEYNGMVDRVNAFISVIDTFNESYKNISSLSTNIRNEISSLTENISKIEAGEIMPVDLYKTLKDLIDLVNNLAVSGEYKNVCKLSIDSFHTLFDELCDFTLYLVDAIYTDDEASSTNCNDPRFVGLKTIKTNADNSFIALSNNAIKTSFENYSNWLKKWITIGNDNTISGSIELKNNGGTINWNNLNTTIYGNNTTGDVKYTATSGYTEFKISNKTVRYYTSSTTGINLSDTNTTYIKLDFNKFELTNIKIKLASLSNLINSTFAAFEESEAQILADKIDSVDVTTGYVTYGDYKTLIELCNATGSLLLSKGLITSDKLLSSINVSTIKLDLDNNATNNVSISGNVVVLNTCSETKWNSIKSTAKSNIISEIIS